MSNLFYFISILLLSITCIYKVNSQTNNKPNIIFILADDQGYGDIEPFSIFPNKNSHYKLLTPNLLKMANEGIKFTDAYCGAPVCAPSRCTLMTGKHSGHCSVRENGQFLQINDTTIAQVLKNNGYDTAMFGKWGLGQENGNVNNQYKNDPVSKGFDEYIGQINQDNCHNYYPYLQYYKQNAYYNDTLSNINASVNNCGNPDYYKCTWVGDLWTEYTINYLKNEKRKNKPFFLYLSYTTPHSGSVGSNIENNVPVPRVTQGPYYKYLNEWPIEQIYYATATTQIDTFVGSIFDILKIQGLDNNTVVFYASDNGANNEGGVNYEFFASSGYLSGYKRSLKEGGHRSATLIRWPNKIKGGRISNYQFAFYDFMITAADIAGINLNTLPINDGISILPTLLNENQKQKEFIYHEYCQPNEMKNGWGQAVRINNYTGLCLGNDPINITDIPVCNLNTFELYDLTNDIGQTNDISSSNQDIVKQMMTIMKEQHDLNGGTYCGYANDNSGNKIPYNQLFYDLGPNDTFL